MKKMVIFVLMFAGILGIASLHVSADELPFRILEVAVKTPSTGNQSSDQISRNFTVTFNKPAKDVRISFTQKGSNAEVGSVTAPPKVSSVAVLEVDIQLGLKPNTTYVYLISGTDAGQVGVSAMDTGEFTTSKPEKTGKSGPITITLKSSKTLAQSGESITLIWDAQNADSCTASGGWSGQKASSGSEPAVIVKTTLFSLQCFNTTHQPSVMVDVTMSTSASAPTFSAFKASKTSLARGESTTLSWSVDASVCQSYADPLVESGDWGWDPDNEWALSANERKTSGSQTVTPRVTTRYWLNCFKNEKQTPRPLIVVVDGKRPKVEGPTISLSKAKVTSQGDELTKLFSYEYGNTPADGSLLQTLTVTKKSTGELFARKEIASDPEKGPSGAASLAGFEPDTEYHYVIDLEDPSDGRTARLEGDFKTGNASNSDEALDTEDEDSPPYLVFVRFPDVITKGKSVTLRWESDADYCVASGVWKGKKSPVGAMTVRPVQAKTTYYLQCFNKNGLKSAKQKATVSVVKKLPTKKQPSPQIEFQSSVQSVKSDDRVTLSWNAKNAMNCEAFGPDDWSGLLYPNGEQDVSPEKNETYSLKCWNRHGKSTTASVSVVVTD